MKILKTTINNSWINQMESKLKYRLITGKDDASFCERISNLIKEGYKLYGSPCITVNGKDVIAAQAVILDEKVKSNKCDR
jgi:hypothetical protein